jgi:hypothetical protein
MAVKLYSGNKRDENEVFLAEGVILEGQFCCSHRRWLMHHAADI